MTIKQLIAKLKTFDGDIEVLLPSEGMSSVRIQDNGGIRVVDMYYIGCQKFVPRINHIEDIDIIHYNRLKRDGTTKCLLLKY